MNLTRTTVRIHPELKRAAEQKSLELDITFQQLLTYALEDYLQKEAKEKAKKMIFLAQPLGFSWDSITREDIYAAD
jgi:hypothetical protein